MYKKLCEIYYYVCNFELCSTERYCYWVYIDIFGLLICHVSDISNNNPIIHGTFQENSRMSNPLGGEPINVHPLLRPPDRSLLLAGIMEPREPTNATPTTTLQTATTVNPRRRDDSLPTASNYN